jgi:phosphoribosyl-ATP pyrophosphohydrolase
VNRLIAKVKTLYELDAIHIKRGFRLRTEGSVSVASNHLIEEAVELQAELLWGKREAIVEEAGDLLTLFCHILKRTDISLDEVVNSALEKAEKSYTADPEKITAITPGVTRRRR